MNPGTKLLALPLVAVALLLTLLGSAHARALGATITIDDTGATPTTVTVSPGDQIEFVNASTERHRMRSTTGPSDFDTGDIEPGASATVVVPFEGAYAWEDHRNDHDSRFQGTILVVTGGGTDQSGGDGGGGEGSAPATEASVSVLDRSFSPGSVTIAPNGTVQWTNVSGRDHTVTADDGSFDSGTLIEGATWSLTFDAPGVYPYFCVIHPDMRGVVSVGTDGESPPATVPPPPPPSSTNPPPPPDTTPSTPDSRPATGTVNIIDFAYDPGSSSIRVGDTLVWENFGAAPHTVTAEDGSFTSGNLSSGQTYRRTFTTTGTFTYFCTLHPEMRAAIAVGDAGSPTPPPPPPPPPAAAAESAAPPPPPPPPAATGSEPRAPVTGTVQMIDNAYRPSRIELRVGDTLVWANDGSVPHTATARDGSFDTGFVSPSTQASRRLSSPGTFAFFCTIHPEMTGTLVVEPAPAGSDPPIDDGVFTVSGTDGEEPTTTADAVPQADDGSPEGLGQDVSAPSIVAVVDNAFRPGRLEIDAGTTVVWEWSGVSPHTVTARDGAFDSGILQTGASWSRTFDDPGRYAYYCTLHPDMTGVVEVRIVVDPATALGASRVDDSGTNPWWPALLGGGVFLLGCTVFLTAAVMFLRWSTTERGRLGI
jgi:plastocyanin